MINKTARGLMVSTLLSSTVVASQVSAEDFSVAFLNTSSANTWLSASRDEIEKVAAANGIEVVEFDGQFDGARQTAQMQDAISSGQYDGIILATFNGAGAAPDIELALAEGIQVVLLNQIVGTDLTTADPLVDGIAGSVLAPPFRSGERMANLTVQACENKDPCRVVYFYGIKGIPLDVALKDGFDSVIADHPNIEIVAEGEGKYLGPEQGLTQTQDILQVQPEFEVIIGADQAMQGAQIALEDEGVLENVSIIGLGGSTAALDGIASGAWFGGVMGAPGTEGRLAMEAMVAALKDGKMAGGVDPLTQLPDGGLITQANVDKFTAEWDG